MKYIGKTLNNLPVLDKNSFLVDVYECDNGHRFIGEQPDCPICSKEKEQSK